MFVDPRSLSLVPVLLEVSRLKVLPPALLRSIQSWTIRPVLPLALQHCEAVQGLRLMQPQPLFFVSFSMLGSRTEDVSCRSAPQQNFA